jgi:ADP-heptose:LPS heptosyltransferase
MKILVVSLAGIGDTLFATPLLHELRANFPDSTIDALVLWAGSKDVLQGNPHINTVHQQNLLRAGVPCSLRFLLGLRKRRYDISFNTHPQSRVHYRMVARMVGARTRVSHRYDHGSWVDRLLVNRELPQDYERHCIENNLALLSLIGAKPLLSDHHYELFLADAEIAWARDYATANQLHSGKVLGLHAGSGGTKNLALRRWPLPHYIDLAKRLVRDHPDLRIVVFGGPDEEQDNHELVARVESDRVLRPVTRSLREAAALVRHCDAFLSVDTAFMHLAAAAKVPRQIVIETPTWNPPIQPYNQPFRLVKNPGVAGRNLQYYRYDGSGIKGSTEDIVSCMNSVTVDAVCRELLRALSGSA